jgi:hypothetical protein
MRHPPGGCLMCSTSNRVGLQLRVSVDLGRMPFGLLLTQGQFADIHAAYWLAHTVPLPGPIH